MSSKRRELRGWSECQLGICKPIVGFVTEQNLAASRHKSESLQSKAPSHFNTSFGCCFYFFLLFGVRVRKVSVSVSYLQNPFSRRIYLPAFPRCFEQTIKKPRVIIFMNRNVEKIFLVFLGSRAVTMFGGCHHIIFEFMVVLARRG